MSESTDAVKKAVMMYKHGRQILQENDRLRRRLEVAERAMRELATEFEMGATLSVDNLRALLTEFSRRFRVAKQALDEMEQIQ